MRAIYFSREFLVKQASEASAEKPPPLGCPAFAWITREELSRYEFPAADSRLLERLRDADELWR